MSSGRQLKLDALVARLQLQHGPRAIRKAAPAAESVACHSTTFPALDAALGGGLPRGRITEILGQATSGKLTLAAKTLAAAQRERDALVAWLDLPRTCDPDYLHRCGLDLDRLFVVRPHDGADALAIALHLIESGTLAALVFDGTADLAQVDPAIVSGSLERLAAIVTQTQTVVIFLSEPGARNPGRWRTWRPFDWRCAASGGSRAPRMSAGTRVRWKSSNTNWVEPARSYQSVLSSTGTVRYAGRLVTLPS